MYRWHQQQGADIMDEEEWKRTGRGAGGADTTMFKHTVQLHVDALEMSFWSVLWLEAVKLGDRASTSVILEWETENGPLKHLLMKLQLQRKHLNKTNQTLHDLAVEGNGIYSHKADFFIYLAMWNIVLSCIGSLSKKVAGML